VISSLGRLGIVPTVIVHRDLWDWVGLWATVGASFLVLIAAVLAWVAIIRGNRNAARADAALLRERRMTFELQVLADLAKAAGYTGSDWAGRESVAKALVKLLPDEDIKGLKKFIESGDGWPAAGPLIDGYWQEYQEAVDGRRYTQLVIQELPEGWSWHKAWADLKRDFR
jgi:hypothetical protein